MSTSVISCSQLSNSYKEKLEHVFDMKNCFVEINPGNLVMTPKLKDIVEEIQDLEVREDDIWMISHPRTGSTWCQEMLWLLGNDLDYETAQNTIQHIRSPLLELSAVLINEEYDTFLSNYGNALDHVNKCPSPRFIKSHLPLGLLPRQLQTVNPKIVYVAREPKDLCVSYYKYCQLIHNLRCSFEDFCELFLNNKTPYAPLWPHYLGFWNKRHEANVLFLKYEDMKRDLKGIIGQVADFMGKKVGGEQVDALSEYLSFSSMKKNPGVNLEPVLQKRKYSKVPVDGEFIRKGVVGDWKNFMTTEMAERFDRWTEENTRGTDLRF